MLLRTWEGKGGGEDQGELPFGGRCLSLACEIHSYTSKDAGDWNHE